MVSSTANTPVAFANVAQLPAQLQANTIYHVSSDGQTVVTYIVGKDGVARRTNDPTAQGTANAAQASADAISITVRGAVPGQDAKPLIDAAIAKVKAGGGGGTITLPHIGGVGYYISDTIVIDFDFCTIALDDDVTLTKLNPTPLVGPDAPYSTGVNGAGLCAFLFAGRLKGPTAQRYYIKRPRLIGLRKVAVKTLGDQVTSYTYVVGVSGLHSPVGFQGAIDAECINIRAENGLAGCISAAYVPGMLIDRCTAVRTQYDNGIQILGNQEHLVAVNDNDPSTWANGTIRDCQAFACRNHGIGSYGALGVNIVNPLVVGCGNNTPRLDSNGNITDAGPAGGINFEHDGTNVLRDYHCTVVNPRVYNSYGFGMRSNCKGSRAIGGEIKGTRLPTAYAGNASYPLWGSAVFAQGNADFSLLGTDINGSEAYGLRLSAASGAYPSVYVRGGKYTGCATRVIYGTGAGGLTISPDTLISDNGNATDTTSGSQYCIEITNTAENTDGGLFQIAGRFENNYGGIATMSRTGTLDLTKGISGANNGRAWATANQMISVPDKVTNLHAANISLNNSNGKAARLARISTAVRAYVDRRSIIGDYTNQAFEAFQIVIVSGAYFGTATDSGAYFGYAPTFTPNSTNGNPVIGAPYLTGNMAIGADTPSITPVEGQTLTFTFIQDTVGGRSLSWNPGWKGATLTGPGGANQRAVVTFRFGGGRWVQENSPVWVS